MLPITTGWFFLTGPSQNFLCTGSHANWPGISLSVSSNKGILYLENLGGVQLKKKPPCSTIAPLIQKLQRFKVRGWPKGGVITEMLCYQRD